MGTITLDIDTNAKTVAAHFNDAGKAAQNTGKKMKGMGSIASGLVKQLGTGLGVTGILAGLKSEFDTATKSAFDFNEQLRQVLILGMDVQDIKRLRKEFTKLSVDYGVSVSEITELNRQVISSGAKLTEQQRMQVIEMALNMREVGINAGQAANLLSKTLNIFGDEFDSVADAEGRLVTINELADTDFRKMNMFLPKIMGRAKALGRSFDEVAGAFAFLSTEMGTNEEVVTSYISFLSELNEMEKKGAISAGTLAEQIKQLKESGKPIKNLFGKEALSAADAMFNKLNQIDSMSQKIANAADARSKAMLDELKRSDELTRNEFELRKAEQERKAIARGQIAGTASTIVSDIETELVKTGFGSRIVGSLLKAAMFTPALMLPSLYLQSKSEKRSEDIIGGSQDTRVGNERPPEAQVTPEVIKAAGIQAGKIVKDMGNGNPTE